MVRLTRTAAPANELPGLVVAAGVATLGALVVLGPDKPVVLLAAPIGGMGLVFAARRPLFAVVIMVVLEVTNVSGVLAPHGGLPVFPASLLLGMLAVGFAVVDPQARSRLNAWTAICAAILIVYLATQAVSTIGSVDPASSMASMRRATLDCIFVMLVLLLIQMTRGGWTVAAAIVVPFAVLSMLTVVSEVVFAGSQSFGGFSTVTEASGELITTQRYGGPLPDSNFWGRHLIMGLPLAAALLTRALRSGRRSVVAVWILAIIALLAGIYLTQSRGTYLAAGATMTVWFLASDRSVRKRSVFLLPAALAVFMTPGVGNRLLSALEDVTQADVNYNVDPSVLARIAAQQEAWMMFDERPYFGFGPATFPGQVIEFAGRVPTAVREPTDAPHNLYAEVAGETGVFGLLGLAVLLLGFLSVAILAIVANPRSRDRVLAAAAGAAILGWSAASVSLHMAYFRTFGVVLALAGGLAVVWPVPAGAIRGYSRAVVSWLVPLLLGFFVIWAYLSVNSSSAFTASQRVQLVPVGPIDGWYSYALDIRSRKEMLPTIAMILSDSRSPVDVIADPVRGLLTFTTTALRPDDARDAIQLAVAHADTALHGSLGYQQYSLQAVGSMGIVESKQSPLAPVVAGEGGAGFATATGPSWWPGVLVAAGAGVGTALVAGLVMTRISAQRREDRSRQPATRELV